MSQSWFKNERKRKLQQAKMERALKRKQVEETTSYGRMMKRRRVGS